MRAPRARRRAANRKPIPNSKRATATTIHTVMSVPVKAVPPGSAPAEPRPEPRPLHEHRVLGGWTGRGRMSPRAGWNPGLPSARTRTSSYPQPSRKDQRANSSLPRPGPQRHRKRATMSANSSVRLAMSPEPSRSSVTGRRSTRFAAPSRAVRSLERCPGSGPPDRRWDAP